MRNQKIDSWDQLREQVSSILDRLHADPDLARAAAVNPLHALEELGYQIDPDVRPEIEDRLRFRPRVVVRLRELRERIFEQVGRRFNLQSPEELASVLFDELALRGEAAKPRGRSRAKRPDTQPRPPQVRWAPAVEDPLEVLRGAHPVMELLLEYRRLEASEPRLAPRKLYDEIRTGQRGMPLRRARALLRTQPDP